jgi:DNA-binding winged helix-turn-helix (wHTH) protein
MSTSISYVLDTSLRELHREITIAPLTPQVFDLLVKNRERVVTRYDLTARI